MIHRLHQQQLIPASIEDVWAYFSNPENLNELTPPDMSFEITHGGQKEMYPGQLIEYRVQFIRGIKSRWLTEIAHVRQHAYFVDEQRIGPYQFWYHEHFFTELQTGVKMEDRVTYALPFGVLGDAVHWVWVQRRLNQIFSFRHHKIEQIFGSYAPD
jgi:ligand-binding SRPBCC domain-containing protein